ncbi:MAG: GNAT family N-acetyltransferase [Bacteroidetes bacterium]|nr:GNAT family N-acetyltransferase [Bacteroidota bacterium]
MGSRNVSGQSLQLTGNNEHELVLRLVRRLSAKAGSAKVPAYDFDIVIQELDAAVGTIVLRVGVHEDLLLFNGHIGYFVNADCRGHGFAERAVRLLLPFAARLGMEYVIITCNPDNIPSRRTCEKLGCELLEIVDIPPDHDLYGIGETKKCRFLLNL